MSIEQVILVIYTTKYRLGGHQFPVVARTIADERAEAGFGGEVITRAVESKRDVLQAIAEIRDAGKLIKEFHFVGHSMMGKVAQYLCAHYGERLKSAVAYLPLKQE